MHTNLLDWTDCISSFCLTSHSVRLPHWQGGLLSPASFFFQNKTCTYKRKKIYNKNCILRKIKLEKTKKII